MRRERGGLPSSLPPPPPRTMMTHARTHSHAPSPLGPPSAQLQCNSTLAAEVGGEAPKEEGSIEEGVLHFDTRPPPHSRSPQRLRLMTAAAAALDPSTSRKEGRKEGVTSPHVNGRGGSLLQTESFAFTSHRIPFWQRRHLCLTSLLSLSLSISLSVNAGSAYRPIVQLTDTPGRRRRSSWSNKILESSPKQEGRPDSFLLQILELSQYQRKKT